MRAALFALLLAGCSAAPHAPSHAAPSGDGREWHLCWGYSRDEFACEEGYACTRHGCEWCGPGAETRCTGGND